MTTRVLQAVLVLCLLTLPLQLRIPRSLPHPQPAPLQIVFDVSLSMSASDVAPSRFSVAKQALIDLVKQLPGQDFSLISFSGAPVLSLPWTHDTPALLSTLS